MQRFLSLAKSAYRRALLAGARRRMLAIAAQDTLPNPLSTALNKTFQRDATDDEARWLTKISALRMDLDRSQEPIDVVDYGAGSPQSQRSEDQMRQGVTIRTTVAECSRASKDDFWGTLLFNLVREFKSRRALELGTNLGISAAYQAAAMKLGGGGDVVTLEGAPALAQAARLNLAGLGLENARVVCGRFADTLAQVCAEHGPFDFVFIDGHHDEHATIDYFEKILPFSKSDALFIFDDIEWSEGMRSAWGQIRNRPGVEVAVGLSQLGICLMNPQQARSLCESIALV